VSELLTALLLALLALGIVVLGWWLLIATEGVYLGRRVVIWLYDLYAGQYDDVKGFDPVYEHALLAQPLMQEMAPHTAPLVLDVATGSGRMPAALFNHPAFQGRVIAADLSRQMLRRASLKLRGYETQLDLLWSSAEHLPFADGTFDAVTSLEALEFMEDPAACLREMLRVLRPGGVLFISNRINTRLMPGKIWDRERLSELLFDLDVEQVNFEAWQVDYERVWAIKSGQSEPAGARPLAEILRCPCCPATLMQRQGDRWHCEGCQGEARIGPDGVIELHPLQSRC
jgi:ubiquinone/menaquinone biosynthesis C-methylase UbiE